MSVRGYYKRRRGILEHLEAGRVSLIDIAVHDLICLKANAIVGNGSFYPPGVWIGSAKAIHALCPRQISERAIQRSLDHLEKLGWLKRWMTPGKRGNYPVLIARYSVVDLSGKEYIVNSDETTDWRQPVLVPVTERSSLREVAGAKLSGNKEIRNKNRIKDTHAHSVPGVRTSPSKLFEIWNEEHGSLSAARSFTPEREKKCRSRLDRHKTNMEGFLADFRNAIRRANQTPFLRGESDRAWRADFDWFIRDETNYVRVLEGKYNPAQKEGKTHGENKFSSIPAA